MQIGLPILMTANQLVDIMCSWGPTLSLGVLRSKPQFPILLQRLNIVVLQLQQ